MRHSENKHFQPQFSRFSAENIEELFQKICRNMDVCPQERQLLEPVLSVDCYANFLTILIGYSKFSTNHNNAYKLA